jgi:hypothetical protein
MRMLVERMLDDFERVNPQPPAHVGPVTNPVK